MTSLLECPELLKEWNPNKNRDSKPDNFTFGINKKAWWLWSKGDKYDAIIANKTLRSNVCQYYNGRRVFKENNLEVLFQEITKEL